MSLFSQIQAVAGSIIFGWCISLIWIFIEVFIKDFKHQYLRLLIEVPFFLITFYLYDLFLIYFIDGILNVLYLSAIILGIYLYFKFYNKYFSLFFYKIKYKLKTKILNPIYLKMNYYKDILKSRKEERKKHRNGRKKEKKEI